MALNNMAQQVVKEQSDPALCWELTSCTVKCRNFYLSGQGFLEISVCWHHTALLQQASYMWHTFMEVLAHEDEMNILKQKSL